MAKINGLLIVSLLLLLMSHPAYSRSIREGLDQVLSDGVDPYESKPSFLEWELSSDTDTCEPTYGILPCSSNVWGLLFLIVVYEILLSFGGRYVGIGSELFFKAIGPDHKFGASLFQFLGTIPQIVLVLVSSLTGSVEAAQQQAKMGMGLVAGATAMLLTLLWGFSVVLGSYDPSEDHNPGTESPGTWRVTPKYKGFGVVTDAETSYTARLISATLIPFLILLLAKVFNSSSGRSWIILIAFLVTVILLIAYVYYQTFQPWIRHRRFEHLMDTCAQDKIVELFSKNGKPDQQKIKELFVKIDIDHDGSISLSELRVWLFGIDVDANKLSIERDVESILETFDTNGDGLIGDTEFVQGMTQLVSHLCKHIPDQLKKSKQTNSQLYGGAYMNNIIGLIVFLAPVYARNLSVDVFRDVLVVLIICIVMTLLTSFRTTFPCWIGYVVLLLYPISLALVYALNSASIGL
ncbi:hypothetical protein CDL12_02987 [Handroanthus impetiginosus]|uniref:EF-hand domain-containing protein n=1 Tax=Handroanthus impetiginosus TaxID=429701 RepID=A0A2G9I3E1_9LAMI|nr:hypothetical protein CDL12_02987 [Handroanthus impetiginosus]